MSQIDELSRLLEEAGQSTEEKRARVARGPVVSRRSLLLGLGGLAGAGVLGTIGVSVGSAVFAPAESLPGEPASAPPATATAAVSEAPEGAVGTVVWSGQAGRVDPVLAPGGTGAVIDSEGHVQIFAGGKLAATGQDVTPDAVLVAGQIGGSDVIAWATGKVVSWWTSGQGIQRATHTRPLGLTAVGGGVLVFDDADWSGTLGLSEVVSIPAAADSVTIGVRPDGTSIAATSDGIVTVTPPQGQMQIIQPIAPAEGARVWKVAGLLGEWIVLVWAIPGHDDLPCPVTTVSVDSGASVGTAAEQRATVEDAHLVRGGGGAGLGTLAVGGDGIVHVIDGDVQATGSLGDVLTGTGAAGAVSVDPATGKTAALDPGARWQLSAQKSAWIKDKTTVWFIQNDQTTEKGA